MLCGIFIRTLRGSGISDEHACRAQHPKSPDPVTNSGTTHDIEIEQNSNE